MRSPTSWVRFALVAAGGMACRENVPRAPIPPDDSGEADGGGDAGLPVDAAVDAAVDAGPTPSISSIMPARGFTTGTTRVAITGSNFNPPVTVSFGGTNTVPALDGGVIVVTAPAHAKGFVPVAVTTAAGTATAPSSFEYYDPVAIISVAPPTGPTSGGSALTVLGSGLLAGTTVVFGGAPVTPTAIDPSGYSLTVTAPAGGPFQTVVVSVSNTNGTATRVGAYTYIPTITTIAGGGDIAGHDAGAVYLQGAIHGAFDREGRLVVSLTDMNRIYRVETNGVLTRVAGTGLSRSDPDGPALSTSINYPEGLAFDDAGVLHFTEASGNRVRKVVDASVVTVAGNGVAASAGDDGPAVDASLNGPAGIAFDRLGRLLITEYMGKRVRRVDSQRVITTVAGTGQTGSSPDASLGVAAKLNYPVGIANFPAGTNGFVIADYYNNIVRAVDENGGTRILVGGGDAGFAEGMAATDFKGRAPYAVSATASGDLLVSFWMEARIVRFNAVSETLTNVAGNGTAAPSTDGLLARSSPLLNPIVFSGPGDAVFFIEYVANRVKTIDADGGYRTAAGTNGVSWFGDDGPATEAGLSLPNAIAVQPTTGALFVSEEWNNGIRRIYPDGPDGGISKVAGLGSVGYGGDSVPIGDAGFYVPSGLAFDLNGDLIIADRYANRVRRTDFTTVFLVAGTGASGYEGEDAGALTAKLYSPVGVAIAQNGDIVFADLSNNVVRRISGGVITRVAGIPGATTVDGGIGDGLPATEAALNQPTGVAFDSQQNLYITSFQQHRVRRVRASNGIIETFAGTGAASSTGDYDPATAASVYAPTGICIDENDSVFVAEQNGAVVRQFYRDDAGVFIARTYAGTRVFGFLGDDGPSTSARLFQPQAVACVPGGTVYVADSWNQRIRRIR